MQKFYFVRKRYQKEFKNEKKISLDKKESSRNPAQLNVIVD